MARPREFDRDIALQRATKVFAEHGFEGTSTDALMKAMGISRQSMYDTFGDKWRLYLEALQRYTAGSIGDQLKALNSGPSAFDGLCAHLEAAAESAIADPSPACLGVSAICEFGQSNAEVTMLTHLADRTLGSAIERKIAEAKEDGDVRADVAVADAAGFIGAVLVGIKVSARAGGSPPSLRSIARMATSSLQ